MNKLLKKGIYLIANSLGMLFYDNKYVNKSFFIKYKDVGSKWVIKGILFQKILGFNKNSPWPVCHKQTIVNPKNIIFDKNDLYIFQNPGIYLQANGKLEIGSGTYIGPNAGIITANHDINNLDTHQQPKDVKIGRRCWIGMNAVILPGVILGDHTIVGAGAVVTKSFPDGYCVISGNPAKIIKVIEVKSR